ncbi:MAG: hypothetical protein NTV69_06490, partial [Caldilinea sp.]|nr:hypothetical protein [Caldilinea sp.]
MSRQRAIFILVFGLALAGCGSSPSAPATLAPATLALPTEVLPTPQLARSEEQAADLELIPLLAARQRAIIQSLQQEPPILLLDLPAEDPRARAGQPKGAQRAVLAALAVLAELAVQADGELVELALPGVRVGVRREVGCG